MGYSLWGHKRVRNDSATKQHQIFQNLGAKKVNKTTSYQRYLWSRKTEDFQEEQRTLVF